MPTVLVPQVDKEEHSFTMKLPSDLVLRAFGTVPTSGWKNAELSRRFYLNPPNDGILVLDFTVTTPDGTVLQVNSTVEATISIANAGSNDFWGTGVPLKGVRIHAGTNELELPINGGQVVPHLVI
jgi:hypothetical protein